MGYERVEAHGYRHRTTFLTDHVEPASELLPRVHLVASLLKRWLLGTHQGAVSPVHLDYYVDEFTFRFNRRRSRHPGQLFYRLAQQAVAFAPAPYRQLVKAHVEVGDRAVGDRATTTNWGYLSQADNQPVGKLERTRK